MYQHIARQAVGAAVIAVVSFWGGYMMGDDSASASVISRLPLVGDGLDATPANVDLANFWKVWNTLDARFVETHGSSTPPDAKKRLYGAMQGLTASYGDPYTVFLPPVESKQFTENISGNFGGVGIELDVRDNVLTVVAPLKGTPAEAAGVKAGDLILAIDGRSTENISLDDAIKHIRGEKGTPVTLTLRRADATFDVKLVRDTIRVPESEDGLDETSGVYHIALYQFTATAPQLFNEAFARFKASGSTKLVIDVRGNPGGYLEAAVDIASHFLPKGASIVTEDHKNGEGDERHISYGYNDVPAGTKVVMLIDGGSASASEILAGALHDNKVATLIGKRSFGKGSVQELVPIGEGSLKITIARWLTPSGTSIAAGGLAPEIEVDRTVEDFKAKKDPQMDRAVEFLTKGK